MLFRCMKILYFQFYLNPTGRAVAIERKIGEKDEWNNRENYLWSKTNLPLRTLVIWIPAYIKDIETSTNQIALLSLGWAGWATKHIPCIEVSFAKFCSCSATLDLIDFTIFLFLGLGNPITIWFEQTFVSYWIKQTCLVGNANALYFGFFFNARLIFHNCINVYYSMF